MRMIVVIISILLAIFLLSEVLDKVGMGDVVDRMGERVKGKSGYTKSNFEDGIKKINNSKNKEQAIMNEVDNVLGFSRKEIANQPHAVIKKARERVLKRIDSLKTIQMHAMSAQSNSEWDFEYNNERIAVYKKIFDEAKTYLENSSATYPKKIGNITYSSRRDLAEAALDMRKKIQELEIGNTTDNEVMGYTKQNIIIVDKLLNDLEKVLFELDQKEKIADIKDLHNKFEQEKDINEFEALPDVISIGMDMKVEETGVLEKTEDELINEVLKNEKK